MNDNEKRHEQLGALEEMVLDLQRQAQRHPDKALSYAWFDAVAECMLAMKPAYASRWFFKVQGYLLQHAVMHGCHAPDLMAGVLGEKMNARRRVA